MSHHCINHPEKPAYRRCYHCRNYICSSCASLSFHHYFCSTRCTAFHLFKTVYRRSAVFITSQFRAIASQGFSGIRNRTAMLSLLQLIIVSLLIVNVVISFHFDRQLEILREQILLLKEDTGSSVGGSVAAVSSPIILPVITSEISEVMSDSLLTISGRGSGGYLIALYKNRELYSMTTIENGQFSLREIVLNPGMNYLELRAVTKDSIYTFAEYTVSCHSPHSEELTINITRGRRQGRLIALTFDGGANAAHAEEILTVLSNEKVFSTFFLTGNFIKKYPRIVRRIFIDGHEIGNHTLSHRHLTTFEENLRHDTLPDIDKQIFLHELSAADSLYRLVTRTSMQRYWRSPYGEQNAQLRRWAAELGYRHIGWTSGDRLGENMDSLDWVSDQFSDLYQTAEEIRDSLLNFGKNSPEEANGAIILMHLGTTRTEDFLYELLPEIIGEFRNRGYRFCTISELLSHMDEPAG
ncbi:polysaccharide deacetylase family protein [candidate division KSB1 bacterium]